MGGLLPWHNTVMDGALAVPLSTDYTTPEDLPSNGGNCNGPNAMNDLDLAKHICDSYSACQWFNGCNNVFPGNMGYWVQDTAYDTYIKNTTGTVVKGSTYFPKSRYLNTGADIWCDKYVG